MVRFFYGKKKFFKVHCSGDNDAFQRNSTIQIKIKDLMFQFLIILALQIMS